MIPVDAAAAVTPDGGGPVADAGSDAGLGAPTPSATTCSDLFDPDRLQQYWVEISVAEWTKLTAEFNNLPAVLAGAPEKNYHPIIFHFGQPPGETVTDAAIRLKGQSSWVLTVMNDPVPKMQFVIGFDQVDPKKKFHGVSKLTLDMPRSDWSFLNDRLASTWWRERGVMAPCANSGQLFINGAYYGLYVAEDHVGHNLVKAFFPGNAYGNLLKGGSPPDENDTVIDEERREQFRRATSIGAVEDIVDLDRSLMEWAGDALINNGDGYYGGAHNFYVYDQGAKGYVWLPADNDSTFEWLALNSSLVFNDHPIYWWEGRFAERPGAHFLAVINDPTARRRYVDAIATELSHWDAAAWRSRVDAWSRQIAQAVADDPRKPITVAQWQDAIDLVRTVIDKRPAYLASFVACERDHTGDDDDDDGVRWCDDCRDHDPQVHPGAAEICGNAIDDDCDGLIDEGCPVSTGGADAGAAAPRAIDGGIH